MNIIPSDSRVERWIRDASRQGVAAAKMSANVLLISSFDFIPVVSSSRARIRATRSDFGVSLSFLIFSTDLLMSTVKNETGTKDIYL